MPANPDPFGATHPGSAEAIAAAANAAAFIAGIKPKPITDSGTAIGIDASDFGDAQLIILRCTAATAVTVTLADNVPFGKVIQAIQKGAGAVTLTATTIAKPASLSFTTSEQHASLVAEVEVNSDDLSAEWLLI